MGTTHVGWGCDPYAEAAAPGGQRQGTGVGSCPGCKETVEGVQAAGGPDWGCWGNQNLGQMKSGAMLRVVCRPRPVLQLFLAGEPQISAEVGNKQRLLQPFDVAATSAPLIGGFYRSCLCCFVSFFSNSLLAYFSSYWSPIH